MKSLSRTCVSRKKYIISILSESQKERSNSHHAPAIWDCVCEGRPGRTNTSAHSLRQKFLENQEEDQAIPSGLQCRPPSPLSSHHAQSLESLSGRRADSRAQPEAPESLGSRFQPLVPAPGDLGLHLHIGASAPAGGCKAVTSSDPLPLS